MHYIGHVLGELRHASPPPAAPTHQMGTVGTQPHRSTGSQVGKQAGKRGDKQTGRQANRPT